MPSAKVTMKNERFKITMEYETIYGEIAIASWEFKTEKSYMKKLWELEAIHDSHNTTGKIKRFYKKHNNTWRVINGYPFSYDHLGRHATGEHAVC